MSVWTVVVAAGDGRRFGSDKSVADLGGRPVVAHSVATASGVSGGVVVVVAPGRIAEVRPLLVGVDGAVEVVEGGDTRSASVRAGLAAVPDGAEIVLVHDGARPLASIRLFERVIDAVRDGADAVVPCTPVHDSLRSPVGGPIDRDNVLVVQTPQGFRASVLRAAHAGSAEATDDATLVEADGGRVVVVDGEIDNLKITSPVDLDVARQLVDSRTEADVGEGRIGGGPIRIGQGFDIHPFVDDPDRPLVLGGVVFEGRGLGGHSDADPVAHACTDALLGAAGLGDIGLHFPDSDPRLAGADSLVLLAEAVAIVRRAGWEISNVDCTVVLEEPRLAPRRAQMQDGLEAVIGAPVSVKGKRAEGLGALGRQEGVACLAVALLTRT